MGLKVNETSQNEQIFPYWSNIKPKKFSSASASPKISHCVSLKEIISPRCIIILVKSLIYQVYPVKMAGLTTGGVL